MRVLRRLLCFFAFLLSVAALCTSASEAAAAAAVGPKGDPESPCPSGSGSKCPPTAPGVHPTAPGVQPPGLLTAAVSSHSPDAVGKGCTQENADPTCSTTGSEPEAARTDDCVPSDKKRCPNNDGDTQDNCRDDSGGACTQTEIIPVPEGPGKGPGKIGDENPQDLNSENSLPDADGHSDSGPSKNRETGSSAGTGGVADGRTSTSEVATPPTAPAPAPSTAGNTTVASTAGNSDAPSDNPQHANNEASEGAPSPTTPSSSSSATASDGGSNPTSTENDNTSSTSESTTNTANTTNNEESTTTTTTTTTLPPELTNNKKGDADSSSSISSSVWIRVPLLIVITLACILVC
ncbi:uncharacterized protein TM35_000511220 [Trypanosoma theileri]|uniref:Uncharacterized protein n=1 Tax=Trypanosoma theileri TaxID=67003 RepID=A0A1X0NHE2_9TRYP|nr:uncharacterized protein TM35_000511220 [Trypanosoma theileri]ORC84021.1 hypothetical protein TM35_000511220 [Trypanosoma theileri]